MSSALALALTLAPNSLKHHPLTSSSKSSSQSSLTIARIRTKTAFVLQCRSATCHAPTAPPSLSFSGHNIHHGLSLYDILRVKETATFTEIKTAYRTLAKLYHPDAMSSGSESESDGLDFIEIHNAYATLSDPAARAIYDLSLGRNVRRRSVRAGFYPTRRRWETDQCW